MLYYLFQYLESSFDFPGARLFSYISFRSGVAFILALFIATIIGRRIINKLQILQIGELVRDLGLEGQMSKKGTPTMGGIIIIIAILIPCLLVGRLGNIYMILMLITTVWLGAIGFLDDYIKVFKKNKEGLHGRFQNRRTGGTGSDRGIDAVFESRCSYSSENVAVQTPGADTEVVKYESENIKSTQTTIPFFKNNNLDYADLVPFLGEHAQTGGWVIFILLTIFVVTAVSNGANLTDGLDGLADGNFGHHGFDIGHIGLSVGAYSVRIVFEYHVYTGERGTGRFCQRFYGGDNRFFVV